MKRMFLGKIIGLFITAFVGVDFWNLVIFVGLGHLFDELHMYIIGFIYKKISKISIYQEISEDFVFLFAYWTLFLNITPQRAYYFLSREVIIENPDNIKALYDYYIEDYLVKHGKDATFLGKRISKALKTINLSMEDKIRFFKIVEMTFDSLVLNPREVDINKLKRIAGTLNINYRRDIDNQEYDYEYEYEPESEHKEDTYNYNKQSYNSFTEDISLKSTLTEDVIQAFKVLGFSKRQIENVNLIDAKRAYKEILKEYHPDRLASKGYSVKERQNAEEKTANLNYSMDVVKKYLANS